VNDKITGLEKAALITTGAAAAYKTLLWSLEASVDSTDGSIAVLRIIFAALSFVAFDLVITSVVFRGWSWSGALALLVAAAVSAAIGLDVARVWTMPALHAAPAITLAAFGAHLMWCRRVDLAVLLQGAADTARAEERAARAALEGELATARAARLAAETALAAAPIAQASAAVQVNVGTSPQLPRTIAGYIAARAAELPQHSQAQIAAELGTSADTIRRALERAATAELTAAE
jgi:hypothetical protein